MFDYRNIMKLLCSGMTRDISSYMLDQHQHQHKYTDTKRYGPAPMRVTDRVHARSISVLTRFARLFIRRSGFKTKPTLMHRLLSFCTRSNDLSSAALEIRKLLERWQRRPFFVASNFKSAHTI